MYICTVENQFTFWWSIQKYIIQYLAFISLPTHQVYPFIQSCIFPISTAMLSKPKYMTLKDVLIKVINFLVQDLMPNTSRNIDLSIVSHLSSTWLWWLTNVSDLNHVLIRLGENCYLGLINIYFLGSFSNKHSNLIWPNTVKNMKGGMCI